MRPIRKQYKKLIRRRPKREVVKLNELWNLDVTIADFIIPRLKKFSDHYECSGPVKEIGKNGKPIYYTTKEFKTMISKMITAFEIVQCDMDYYKKCPGYSPNMKMEAFRVLRKECDDKFKEGMELFAKYICALWW